MELRDYLTPGEYILAVSKSNLEYAGMKYNNLVLTNQRLILVKITTSKLGFFKRNQKEDVISLTTWNLADISEVVYKQQLFKGNRYFEIRDKKAGISWINIKDSKNWCEEVRNALRNLARRYKKEFNERGWNLEIYKF